MSIPIKEVVAITGTPGLHRVIKTDEKAIVVESLDPKRKRQLVKGSMMVSKLTDVSIYTTDESEPLANVLRTIQAKYAESLPVNKDSGKEDLMAFLGEVLPTFDREKVYPSNIKKLVSWYEILVREGVDLAEEKPDTDAEVVAEEVTADAGETA
jgi:hypothetical protein